MCQDQDGNYSWIEETVSFGEDFIKVKKNQSGAKELQEDGDWNKLSWKKVETGCHDGVDGRYVQSADKWNR